MFCVTAKKRETTGEVLLRSTDINPELPIPVPRVRQNNQVTDNNGCVSSFHIYLHILVFSEADLASLPFVIFTFTVMQMRIQDQLLQESHLNQRRMFAQSQLTVTRSLQRTTVWAAIKQTLNLAMWPRSNKGKPPVVTLQSTNTTR